MSDVAAPEPAVLPVELVRSEERLGVTTRRVPIGKAVLRKVIVVEHRTITIDVAHEEVVLDHVPFEDGDDEGARGAHLALPDLVLYEEHVVITKRTVPTERVRLAIETVTEERRVTADVRRELVELADDTTAG